MCTHLLVFEGDGEVVFTVGNYDDYLRYKERQEPAAPPVKPTARASVAKPVTPSGLDKPRRLTWKEKREIEGMEDAIHAAEAEVRRLESLVNDPSLYQRGYKAAQDAVTQLEEARAAAETLYHRWEELESCQ